MAITSGLFNSMNGDRRYNAKWFARYFATFIGNGVFPNPSTGLQVIESESMTTIVKVGDGWINGYFIVNDGDYELQHDLADGVLKRIDRIVMRLNYLSRQIEIDIKKGTFASVPIAPLLVRDADIYELALADVMINNGATVITQANITDLRLNNNLCGIVHGTVDQVDTTTLFNQYQSWMEQQEAAYENDYEQWSTVARAEFEQWFLTIQDILDENTAGNLLSLITSNTDSIGDKLLLETDDKTNLVSAINENFNNTARHLAETKQEDVHGLGFGGILLGKSINQSIADNISTAVNWDSVVYQEKYGFYDPVTPSKIKIPLGVTKVRLSASILWDGVNNDTARLIHLYKNGSTSTAGLFRIDYRTVSTSGLQRGAMAGSSAVLNVVEGDEFEIYVRHVNGTSINVASNALSWFALEVIE